MVALPTSKIQHLATVLTARLRANRIRIPPYPAVAARLQQLLNDPRHTAAGVAGIVADDSTLAASIVARASSPLYGGGCSGIGAAIARLGTQEVIRVALAQNLGAAASAGGPLAGIRRDTWRRSVISARIARELAPARRIDPDQAFVAGLVHDFGEVVVVAALEGLASEHELPVLPWASWQQLVQSMHGEFGAVIAARWNLPPALAEVVVHHHEASAHPLVQLVALVDKVVHLLDTSPCDGVTVLNEVPQLDPIERARIARAMPQVVEHLAELETSASLAASTSSKIAVEPPPDDDWPVDFNVIRGLAAYRAVRLSPNELVIEGLGGMQPNWLIEIELFHATAVKILVNIKSCETHGDTFRITARPFALGGESKQAWMQMLAATRPAVRRNA